MLRHAQTTTVVERVIILERATAGETDSMIAAALGCSTWTVRKWRRRRPAPRPPWPDLSARPTRQSALEYHPTGATRDHPHPPARPSWLGARDHPGRLAD